jgi:hypothetical protein
LGFCSTVNFPVLRINSHLIFLFHGPGETQVGLVLSLTYAFILNRTEHNSMVWEPLCHGLFLFFFSAIFFSNVRTFNSIIMITTLKKLGIFKCIHGIGWWTNPWAGDNKQTNKLDLVLTIMEPNLILYRFSESLAIVTHQKARWNFIGCFFFNFFYGYRPQTCFVDKA